MTHPHQLHATAALHSLRAAARHLATQADAEARNIAAAALEPADGLHGWRPAIGSGGRGGHGDPAAGAALHGIDPAPGINRWAQLAASTTGTLGWLADQLHTPPAVDPLQRLQAAIPGLHPKLCATVTRWVQEADQRIRRALGITADQWPLPPGVACPACGVRLLRTQTSPPDTADWTIVCGNGCLCTGDDCGCGMPVRAAGVRHIWTATSPLATSAFAGAALARTA